MTTALKDVLLPREPDLEVVVVRNDAVKIREDGVTLVEAEFDDPLGEAVPEGICKYPAEITWSKKFKKLTLG